MMYVPQTIHHNPMPSFLISALRAIEHARGISLAENPRAKTQAYREDFILICGRASIIACLQLFVLVLRPLTVRGDGTYHGLRRWLL